MGQPRNDERQGVLWHRPVVVVGSIADAVRYGVGLDVSKYGAKDDTDQPVIKAPCCFTLGTNSFMLFPISSPPSSSMTGSATAIESVAPRPDVGCRPCLSTAASVERG